MQHRRWRAAGSESEGELPRHGEHAVHFGHDRFPQRSHAHPLQHQQQRFPDWRAHEIHFRWQTMCLCTPVPLLRSGISHHELPYTRMHAGDGGTFWPAAGTCLRPQGTLHGLVRGSYHVHCRAEPSHVWYVRYVQSAHRHYGRLTLSGRTDETCRRENVYEGHQCIRAYRSFSRHDSLPHRRFVWCTLQHGGPWFRVYGSKSDRSGNWRGMSHRRTRRDVQQRV